MANAAQLVAAFRDMSNAKSLSPDEIENLVREGIMAALGKLYGPNVQAEIEIDESGDIEILVLKRVVEEVEDESTEVSLAEAQWDDPGYEVGDIMEIPVEFEDFGRNAVMAAKQRIIQGVREGERERIREEYEGREGELLHGEVQQIWRGKIMVMLSQTKEAEAVIPWREQNPRERFRQGDPIRAVLRKVEETPKGPRLILSRAAPEFVASLFALEVPEIYQGIVEIREIAREAGGRTKIAVSSRDESVDPVGACVGLKGSRVQAVVSELSGERIDIVPWHPDPEVFARRALAPAKVAKVLSDAERKVITAIVDEDQLSLAIGRNGQNVRLASQLIGWQIDLYGSREWLERGAEAALFGGALDDERYEVADFSLEELELEEGVLAALEGAGFSTFFDIMNLERSEFLEIDGVGEDAADELLEIIDQLTVIEEIDEEAEDAEAAQESVETEGDEAPEAEGEGLIAELTGGPDESDDSDEADEADEAGEAGEVDEAEVEAEAEEADEVEGEAEDAAEKAEEVEEAEGEAEDAAEKAEEVEEAEPVAEAEPLAEAGDGDEPEPEGADVEIDEEAGEDGAEVAEKEEAGA